MILIFSVKIDLVFLDDTNKPVDALESVKILENAAVQDQLATSGVTISTVAAQESMARPVQSGIHTCNLGLAAYYGRFSNNNDICQNNCVGCCHWHKAALLTTLSPYILVCYL